MQQKKFCGVSLWMVDGSVASRQEGHRVVNLRLKTLRAPWLAKSVIDRVDAEMYWPASWRARKTVAQRVNTDLAAHEEIKRLDGVFAISAAELASP